MRRTLLAALAAITLLTLGPDAGAEDLVGTPPGAERTAERPAEVDEAGEAAKPDGNQPPQTQPPDLGFGEHQLSERYHFPDPKQYRARVDRRDDIDATADRTILWPTAHTPRRNRVSYSNYMLLLNQLSFSPTDDVELTGTVSFADAVADFHTGLAAKITVSEGPNSIVSIQPFGFYHTETTELSNRDFGLGTAVLADFMVNDDFVFTLGGAAFATIWFGSEEFSYAACQSREDFLDGTCRETTTSSTVFPSGGHWLGGQAGLTWYIFDSFSLRGELMTGVAAGSVLGTEWIGEDPTPADSRARFTAGDFSVGIPYGSIVTAGTGLAWSNGLFAAQLSGYVTRAPSRFEDFEGNRPDMWVLVPMLNVSAALF